MKFYLSLILLVLIAFACDTSDEGDVTIIDKDTTVIVDGENNNTVDSNNLDNNSNNEGGSETLNYKNMFTPEDYNFTVKYPDGWNIDINMNTGNRPVISIFKEKGNIKPPLKLHEDASFTYISIFPNGYGTELPSGTRRKLEAKPDFVNFDIIPDESYVFKLENGQPWAYIIKPAELPLAWGERGFIFVQFANDNFSAKCVDKESGKEKPLEKCDPLEGDIFRRYGNINPESEKEAKNILSTFEFLGSGDGNVKDEPITDLIRVHKPDPEAEISSPYTTTGKARGFWFFEGDFPIVLKDESGKVIGRSIAKAKGNWMTEDWVDFTSTIEFEKRKSGSGILIFKRDNPSGNPENDRSFSLKVNFK